MPIAPPLWVDPPPFIPAPGLLTAVPVIDNDDPHSRNGVQSWAGPCGEVPAADLDECVDGEAAETNPAIPYDADALGAVSEALPLTLVREYRCAPQEQFGSVRSRAIAAFTASESAAAERELADRLAGEATVPVPVAQDDPLAILSLLESIRLTYGGTPLFHVPPQFAYFAADRGAIAPESNLARDGYHTTVTGARMIPGRGYTLQTVGPDDDDPDPIAGEYWLYATGSAVIHRGAVEVPAGDAEALDRAVNTRSIVVQRTLSVLLDCAPVIAVRANLTALANITLPG